jgi:hypothetical protein
MGNSMTIHQAKRPKPKRRKTPAEIEAERARREAERARIAQYRNPNQILSFEQWCLLNGISKATGNRILARGPPDSPVVTDLSPRRRGITVGNNASWQESRGRNNP